MGPALEEKSTSQPQASHNRRQREREHHRSKFNYKGKHHPTAFKSQVSLREFSVGRGRGREMEVFCILSVVVVTRTHTCIKTQNAIPKKGILLHTTKI